MTEYPLQQDLPVVRMVTQCDHNGTALLEPWGLNLSQFRGLLPDLDRVTAYYPLKLSSSGVGDIAYHLRNHTKQPKSRFYVTYSPRQHLVLALSDSG